MAKKQSGAFALYATILVSALFFFLLGVYVGGRLASGPAAAGESTDGAAPPVEDPRPKLDFYEELRKPQDPSESEAGAAAAPTPEIVVNAGPAAEPPPAAGQSGQGAPPRSNRLKDPETASAAGERFTIQVAALKTAAEARQVLIRLQAKGYDAKLVEPIASDPDYYRVWVGAFERRAEADALEARLKVDDFPTYLKKVNVDRVGN